MADFAEYVILFQAYFVFIEDIFAFSHISQK